MLDFSSTENINNSYFQLSNKKGNNTKILTSQNARSSTNIHHDLIFKHIRIAHNCRMVRSHAIVIGQHLLLMVQLRVRAEVIGKVSGLCGIIAVVGGNVG